LFLSWAGWIHSISSENLSLRFIFILQFQLKEQITWLCYMELVAELQYPLYSSRFCRTALGTVC
jgi:hypothetical protein